MVFSTTNMRRVAAIRDADNEGSPLGRLKSSSSRVARAGPKARRCPSLPPRWCLAHTRCRQLIRVRRPSTGTARVVAGAGRPRSASPQNRVVRKVSGVSLAYWGTATAACIAVAPMSGILSSRDRHRLRRPGRQTTWTGSAGCWRGWPTAQSHRRPAAQEDHQVDPAQSGAVARRIWYHRHGIRVPDRPSFRMT